MKKFIFGLMLLVSMLGIVGCSMDSSDSTSDPVPETSTEEEIVYTIKNESGVDVIFIIMNLMKVLDQLLL